MIKAIHGMQDVLCGNGIEATLLWEELSDQSVHVLVGAALPGSVRMREEEVRIELLGNSFVLRKLFAVVGRQRMDTVRERRQQGNHDIGYGVGSFAHPK